MQSSPSDIENMFLQFGVPPCDRDSCLRFFCGARMPHRMWKFFSIPGIISVSANLPRRAQNPHFSKPPTSLEASRAITSRIITRFYEDDYLVTFENHHAALRISNDLVNLLKLGGFRLTKVVSNVSAIEENLNPSFNVIAKV